MEKAINSPRCEWFRDWFDENYEIVYRHRTEAEAEDFVSHWPIDWNALTGKRALDIGCGNGRFSRAISGRGMKPTGIDLSVEQLRLAATNSSGGDVTRYIRADMRQLPLKPCFSLVVNLFTSFGYFDHDENHSDALGAITRLLLPGGIIIIDLPCREHAIREVAQRALTTRTVGGVEIEEKRSLVERNARFEKEIRLSKEGVVSYYRESVRLFSAEELLGMTTAASLRQIEPLWGDYAGGTMSDSKPRMVYFGKKNG